MVPTGQIVLGVVAALCFLGVTFHLTRRRLISERISLVWLAISIGLLVLALSPEPALTMAAALGFKVTSNAIFTFALLVVVAFNLFVTVRLSQLDQRLRRLAQDQALGALGSDPSPTERRSGDSGEA